MLEVIRLSDWWTTFLTLTVTQEYPPGCTNLKFQTLVLYLLPSAV